MARIRPPADRTFRQKEPDSRLLTSERIANDLRGSVDGWDFKSYVLGMLFYRFISENLADYLNRQERRAGHPDFDEVRRRQQRSRIDCRVHHVHGFHPLLIRCQTSSAFCAACSVVEIFFGHGRLNPSEGHLRVASIPILLPIPLTGEAKSR